jgi:RNA polymerase sigma-70 factor (ECF subfamily)
MARERDGERSAGGAGGRFATTRWSVVLAARDGEEVPAREALATLCGLYWYPLYAFARRRGAPPEEAQDLTQAFFTHLLEKEAIRHVDPGRGRFRSFLLASFKNFQADEREKARAKKRGGGQVALPIDGEAAEGRYALEPSHGLTPERIYEKRWALTLIERVLERLRERHARAGKEHQFERLRVFLAGERRPVPYAEVARRLEMSELAVKVAVHRLRKRFRELLREEIAQTVAGQEEVEAELRALQSALKD